MEINNENKARFFAQYYGQKVLNIRRNDSPVLYVGFDDMQNNNVRDDDYLELKPISSISDEDCEYLLPIVEETAYMKGYMNPGMVKGVFEYFGKRSSLSGRQWNQVIDYLRSKGYAWEWNGITVNQMVESGWIILKDPT